jgi:hypothetical protein
MSHASAASAASSKALRFQIHQGRLHLEATSEPIAIRSAFAALERQPELAAPVKLVALGAGEAALMAEIPRALAEAVCEDLARRALEAGWRWLEGGDAKASAGGDDAKLFERVERALEELRWSWKRLEGGGYRVDAEVPEGVYRVTIAALAVGELRLSTSTTVRSRTVETRRALLHFALESNRRLRLARLTVAEAEGERARAVWDAVLPAVLPPESTLIDAVEAVVDARVATGRALGALGDPRVAQSYLRLQEGGAPPATGAATVSPGAGSSPAAK